MRLFLAFPDGVYHYSCQECNAHCCHGQGFGGNLKKEMTPLLKLYPNLGLVAKSRNGEILDFVTPTGRCYFLGSDNFCRIEKDHGKALKPGVCSLFPFNSLSRIGNTVVVSPHFMCPLRLKLPAQPGKVTGTHSEVEKAVKASGLLERVPKKGQKHPQGMSARKEESLLQRESAFRDACGSAIHRRLSFRDFLQEQSTNNLGDFVKRAAALLGINVLSQKSTRDSLDDLLLALASPIRLRLLDLKPEEVVRILALAEVYLRQVSSLSEDPPTLQGTHQILVSIFPVLRLLARGHRPPVRQDAIPAAPKLWNPELTFASVIFFESQKSMGVLAALECALPLELSLTDRTLFLRHIAQRMSAAAASLSLPK